jgi:hypothetical protein
VLRSSGRSPTHLDDYYFQLWPKAPITYIASLTPGKWDWWREDWVIVQPDIHNRLVLSSGVTTGKHSDWERVPTLPRAYESMVKRI